MMMRSTISGNGYNNLITPKSGYNKSKSTERELITPVVRSYTKGEPQ